MANTCGASFAVRFLNNGDYIRIFTEITKEDGSPAALFQIVDANSGMVTPVWTGKPADQPIISFSALSTVGNPVEITAITWGFHGKSLVFPQLTEQWEKESNGQGFEARMNGGIPQLRIVKNIASADALSNRQITYEIAYVSNGMSDRVQGSLDVLIQAAGENSYSLQILTANTVLSEQTPATTLSVIAYYGSNKVEIGKNGYSVEWFQGENKIEGISGSSLRVTRDMVEGGSVFVAKLVKDGNVVAQDGQRVNDIADEYQIDYFPVGSGVVGSKSPAIFTLSVTKNARPLGPGEKASFAWDVYNAIGVVTHRGTGDTVTVTADYCKVNGGTKENPMTYYSGVDVNVTANIN